MKKFLSAVAAFAMAASAIAAPPKKPGSAKALPNFSFKEAVAGAAMDTGAVGKCSPRRDGAPGELECEGNDGTIAGIQLLLPPTYYFYNGRLTSMLFLYDNNATNYLTFLQAFVEKYGQPCSRGSTKWQNKAGSTFDNSFAVWCFKTGKLKLEQLGPSLDYGVVTYDDDYKAPAKATPKDF